MSSELEFDLCSETQAIFSPEGLLAEKLNGYEPRPGQLEMAQAIADILHDEDPWGHNPVLGKKLAVEAETGIGKTLAYLIPAVLSGQKIVVSTGTINLQEQILHKEIPFIKEHIDPTLEALCVKGRQNYLCIYRYHQFTASPQAPLFQNIKMDALEEWIQETETGDRAGHPVVDPRIVDQACPQRVFGDLVGETGAPSRPAIADVGCQRQARANGLYQLIIDFLI